MQVSLSCLISLSKSILYLLVLRNISALMRKPLIQRSQNCQLLTFYSLQPLLLGDPQHQTFLLSPLPCTHLSTSRLTIVTPSLYCPHPNTISSPINLSLHIIVSLSPPLYHHFPFPSFIYPFLCLHLYLLSHTAYLIILLFYGSTFIC